MHSRHRILAALADGRFHSGEELGARLGISRAAVWKHLKDVRELGIRLFAVRGRGYALEAPLELLDRQRLCAQLDDGARGLVSTLELHPELDSTNRHLSRLVGGLASGHACLAERQHAGRGRRGRSWVSPFGRNVYLSVYWRFPCGPATLSGLSLAAGVAAARAVEEAGIGEVGLKWPNDLVWRGRKLGGMLLEITGEAGGPCHVIIGVGLNVGMTGAEAGAIDQPWMDLAEVPGSGAVSRNVVAGLLLKHLVHAASDYERYGPRRFIEAWRERDAVCGQAVELRLPDRAVSGVARGIDESGALLLDVGGTVGRFAAGEVSLRLQA
jgi:BirA family biotin operon repressor/biotin-[acetyl-CoA-carboxylase] ligase